MSIEFMAFCPHPPVIIPQIGSKESEKLLKTKTALQQLAHKFEQIKEEIDTVIFITPHGPVFQDAVSIWRNDTLSGNLGRFNDFTEFQYENDLALGLEIIREAERKQIMMAQLDEKISTSFHIDISLDHGVLVPASFFSFAKKTKMIPISIGLLGYDELYQFGMAVAMAIEKTEKKVAVIVSGDLSHRVTEEAPGGYHQRGSEFDQQVISLLKEKAVIQLINLESDLIETAGECGFRPLIIGLGLLDTYDFAPEVLSYEAPFGVGYLVCDFAVKGKNSPSRSTHIQAYYKNKIANMRANESAPVKLARQTVESLIGGGKVTTAPKVISGFDKPAGVFVSLKKNQHLRGCIGTIEPTKKNATYEIVANAIGAAVNDPRFNPVTLEELDYLEYSVDLLTELEQVEDKKQLNPKKYGVIVEANSKKGLLLPDLSGVDTVEQQLAIAIDKAGISKEEDFTIKRFQVTRYT